MPPIAQYVFNGIVTGGILALPTVAFSLLWRLLRFPNFAVSTYLTVGAYAALALNAGARAPLEAAWLGALLATGGVAMRATADNPLLAAVKGVPTDRVIAAATFGGGALAGGAGVFLGLDASIDPLMGGGIIISVFAAAILGGIGSAPGAFAGALIVGIVEETGTLIVPPTYKTATGFVIILAVLLVRPSALAASRSSV